MRVLRKNPEPARNARRARILPLKGVGKRNAAAALGLVLQATMPVHATAARAAELGAKLSGNIRPDPWALPSRTMIVP